MNFFYDFDHGNNRPVFTEREIRVTEREAKQLFVTQLFKHYFKHLPIRILLPRLSPEILKHLFPHLPSSSSNRSV